MLKSIIKCKKIIMKYKSIEYWRKSTDREDKQQNSLEAQKEHNNITIEKENLEVIKEIYESASAKKYWTRKWFNEMIQLFQDWKASILVVDEPTRLSRNTMDTALIISLLEEWYIKAVYSYWNKFFGDNIMQVNFLEDMMKYSKVDNKFRSKSTKDKMLYIAEHKHKLMNKAPFWYKNITIEKWNTDVIPSPENAYKWKKMLELLWEKKSYQEVAQIMFDRYWVTNKNWQPVTAQRIKEWLFHKFHEWLFQHSWQIFEHRHKLIVSPEYIFEIRKKRENKIFKKTSQEKFPLKWLLKTFWRKDITLTAYQKKWHIYYNSPGKYSDNWKHLNINQNLILESFWNFINNYSIKDKKTLKIIKKHIKNYYSEFQEENIANGRIIKSDLTKLEAKQSNLLNLLCDGQISQDDFKKQKEKYVIENQKLVKQLKAITLINDEILENVEKSIELLVGLSDSYKRWDLSQRVSIIKMVCIELFIDTKKQLYIKENELFEILILLNFSNGVLDGIWTHDLQSHNLAF